MFSVQVKDQRQEIDALLNYHNGLLSPSNGLSVVVDDSQLGHDAFIQVVEKCSESGREIVGHYILKGEVTEEAMLALHLHHSNNLFAGIGQKSFPQMINMTEEMGLASFNDNLKMFMTKRTISGITGICNKPIYNYYIANNQLSPSYIASFVKNLNACRRFNEEMGINGCIERLVEHYFPTNFPVRRFQIYDSKEYFCW